jgi:hypothetical protein
MSGEHQTWSVDSTAYLRNLDREDLRAECIAVHYQSAPTKTERGTSIGLRFPTLIVAGYVEKPRQVADKIAAILNAHWIEDDATTPPARSYADGVEGEAIAHLANVLFADPGPKEIAARKAATDWWHQKDAAIRLSSQGGKANG